jgi:hypothetical protein
LHFGFFVLFLFLFFFGGGHKGLIAFDQIDAHPPSLRYIPIMQS